MKFAHMGEMIAQQRKAKEMTQKDLADRLNITDKAVSKWERGISCPDIATISHLAQELDLTPDELLGLRREAEGDTAEPGEDAGLVTLILRAVGTAMGVAGVVLSILGRADGGGLSAMLSIGLACLGIASLREGRCRGR